MPVLRQLISLEPLIVLAATLGFGYLTGKRATGTAQPIAIPIPRSHE